MTSLRCVTSPDWAEAHTSPDEPVMLLLHGYGSHEHDLAGLAPMLPPGLPWASVRAPLDMGYGAAAWFPLDPTLGSTPQSVLRATDALWDWIDEAVPADTPLIPLGFSQGGCMALQLLRTRPERIVGTIMLAGFAAMIDQAADASLETARPWVFWGYGDADLVVPASVVHDTRAWLNQHVDVHEVEYPALGHGIDERVMRDVGQFLQSLLDESQR